MVEQIGLFFSISFIATRLIKNDPLFCCLKREEAGRRKRNIFLLPCSVCHASNPSLWPVFGEVPPTLSVPSLLLFTYFPSVYLHSHCIELQGLFSLFHSSSLLSRLVLPALDSDEPACITFLQKAALRYSLSDTTYL